MLNKFKIALHIILGFCFVNLAHSTTNIINNHTKASSDVRLYALNCGLIKIHDGASFSDTGFYSHKSLSLVDPCFLIKHNNSYLMWDLGLGEQYIGKTIQNTEHGVTLSATTSLITQLKELNLTPDDINYVGISHFHFDHTGNANLFPNATLLIQRAEYNSLEQNPLPPAVNNDLKKILQPMKKTLILGDQDVFGDGTVVMLKTPGHTVGHQSLQLKLQHSGTIILSGDLYHSREAYHYKQVPTFNASRADTMASMNRVDEILQNRHGRLIIQHDARDFATLPKFPKFLD
ncbi:MAG: N-acyl homoserine lactonase family protein [Burkholderiales bacterium]|jgi:glyoxylase-like metal-dependent hydrolase (beta-lactamase superfamily II)|nr:N-acyl homoserine lactonase family protein [Burkholderiales bacterium]